MRARSWNYRLVMWNLPLPRIIRSSCNSNGIPSLPQRNPRSLRATAVHEVPTQFLSSENSVRCFPLHYLEAWGSGISTIMKTFIRILVVPGIGWLSHHSLHQVNTLVSAQPQNKEIQSWNVHAQRVTIWYAQQMCKMSWVIIQTNIYSF